MTIATIERTTTKQQPKTSRVLRWDKATQQYVEVIVTAAMIEADRRREAFVAEFNIYEY